ncbi:MAG: tetratricopeptide repeat protein [Alphaproteobacteria bacterium]|nr:tetratricopeptide repeat protein [Alphaproteobacteria bacterium]
MRRKDLISASLAMLLWAVPAAAVDFEHGVAAFHAGDYGTARSALEPLAEKGDGVAQYYVGRMLLEGLGVEPDRAAAFRWLSFAAVFGVPAAQHLMAEFYLDKGLGVEKNVAAAAGWLEEAAAQHYPPSQHRLAMMYKDGDGKPQSYAHAEELFRGAAEQGMAEAQFELGSLFYRGLGVPQDFSKAVHWSRRAAEQGHTKAQVNLGYLYAAGKGIDRDFVQAHKWFNLAAAVGDEEALAGRETVALQMSDRQIIEAQKIAGNWRAKLEQTQSAAAPTTP